MGTTQIMSAMITILLFITVLLLVIEGCIQSNRKANAPATERHPLSLDAPADKDMIIIIRRKN